MITTDIIKNANYLLMKLNRINEEKTLLEANVVRIHDWKLHKDT